jgi:predicted nucleotidyltransferase
MSTSAGKNSVSSVLFHKARQEILSLLYGHPQELYYLRQIVRSCKIGIGSTQRELKILSDAGIILREQRGSQIYYRANLNCPYYSEIKKIIGVRTKVETWLPDAIAISNEYIPEREPVARNRNITVPKARIAEFCEQHHIRYLYLFGSVIREDFRPDNDIDILLEFELGHVPGFFGIFDMEQELSRIFGGRRIDLRTPKDLSRYSREEVLATAELHYAQK